MIGKRAAYKKKKRRLVFRDALTNIIILVRCEIRMLCCRLILELDYKLIDSFVALTADNLRGHFLLRHKLVDKDGTSLTYHPLLRSKREINKFCHVILIRNAVVGGA